MTSLHERPTSVLTRKLPGDREGDLINGAGNASSIGTLAERLKIKVYFCDPHNPWQRTTNENTNGLIRQYLPKGIDLSNYSRKDLDKIADSLNNRPRKVLGFRTPLEAYQTEFSNQSVTHQS